MIPNGVIVSDSGTITVSIKGKLFSFATDHMNYNKVKESIKRNDFDSIPSFADIPKSVQDFSGERVTVKDGNVMFKGKSLNNNLTRRILTLMNEGFPFTPMLNFLDNLMQNPSCHAVKELYNFLVNRNLPITEDGCFLAYKAVRSDYLDWYTGTVDNKVGAVIPAFERNEVDDNWRVACSSGYHVGAVEYIERFHAGEGHVMIVKVNPKDVVSVPEAEVTKCRVTVYEVVGEMDAELVRPVYATTPTTFTPAESSNSMSSPIDDDDDEPDDDDDYGWGGDDDDDDEDDSELDLGEAEE